MLNLTLLELQAYLVSALKTAVRNEPVGTAVIIGLVTAAVTSTFSGFIVGVVAIYLVSGVMASEADEEETPGTAGTQQRSEQWT